MKFRRNNSLPRCFSALAAVVILCGFSVRGAFANGEDNASGTARAMNALGIISSGGSYSAYTGSMARTVPDLEVPGGVGDYPLVFARTSTSRYVPGDDGDGGAFGGSGSWRHSYRWGFYRDNPGVTPAIVRIHYPEGRVVKFTAMSVAAPAAGSPVPSPDPYLRSVKPGVEDRLENVNGNGDYILHRHDGGTVYFQKQSDAAYHVAYVADPYNLRTTFAYYGSGETYPGKLKSLTEPGGRWLQIVWGSFNGSVVVSSVSASNGQAVGYYYTVVSGYTALALVDYASDPNPAGGNCQATYGYQADNTGAGGRPLLHACTDPHFAGPMPRIRYNYTLNSSVPYGQISAEIDDASNAAVSSYDQTNLTEATGDGANSYYAFNGYLITNQQDHDAGHSGFGYDANSYLSSITNANNHNTTITREPYVGKRTAISRPDSNGQSLTTLFDYGSTSQAPYPVQPYWVMSVTDPHGQKTIYTRNGNHQITQINYPDGTYENFSYNSLGGVTYHRKTDSSAVSAVYDASGRVNSSTDSANGPANRNTLYAYDALGRVSQVTDFNNHNTWLSYNGCHVLTQIKHDDGTHVDFTYDLYGNRTSVSDELQHVTTFTYDNHRRPTSVKVPVNTAANSYRTTTFSYERGNDSTVLVIRTGGLAL